MQLVGEWSEYNTFAEVWVFAMKYTGTIYRQKIEKTGTPLFWTPAFSIETPGFVSNALMDNMLRCRVVQQ